MVAGQIKGRFNRKKKPREHRTSVYCSGLSGLGGKNMSTIRKNRVLKLNKIVALMIAITIGFTVMPGFVPKVYSHDHHHHHHHHWHHGNYGGDAFLGGMVAENVLDSQATPAPAPAATPTDQQRLDQLNKLGAGGYITPEEYKAKKKAILDSM
jgi:hypothetical protein